LHYSPEYWPAIGDKIPLGAIEKHVRQSLEQEAQFYAMHQLDWREMNRMKADSATAKKVAVAADAFLDALEKLIALDKERGDEPIYAFLGLLDSREQEGQSVETIDPRIADERYTQMIKAVRKIGRAGRNRALPGGMINPYPEEELRPIGVGVFTRSRKGEKILRLKYIEGVAQTWTHLCRKTLDGDDIGPALDFIEAATRPVLLGGDQFGQGESGRDALGKLVDAFRSEGFKYPRYHWEIYAQR
jgi:hypothetical protein